ncbi:MAG: BON domain-containing protein [Vicinamibacterales bacterium]
MTQRWRTLPALAFAAVLIGTPACGRSTGHAIDDAATTARVKTALLGDENVGGLQIDVDTFQGVVTLSGAVSSEAEVTRAVALAKGTPGVKDVRSTLEVTEGDVPDVTR